MKQFFLSAISLLTMSLNINGQSFVSVSRSNNNQQVTLSASQVLEVKLPLNPSTGYSWYMRNNDRGMLKQVGGFDFTSYNPQQPLGAPGIQTMRFVAISKGNTDLELIYARYWQKDVPADSYKIKVITEGSYVGTYTTTTLQQEVNEVPYKNTTSLPYKFNWVEKSIFTPVKELTCGSSWAGAACGVFEALIKAKDGKYTDISEQWMINCIPNNNCDGGQCPFEQFKLKGAVYEQDEPFKGANGTCDASYTYHEKADDYAIDIPNTTDQIKEAIYKYGPVWSSVCVGAHFMAYRSGVLDSTDVGKPNHCVVLCGWDDSTRSWVLRNSWGAVWGEKGYMRIKYGTCGVGTNTAYLVYKGGFSGVVNNTAGNASPEFFPNPSVDGTFNVKGLQADKNVIEVYDVVGKLIYKRIITTENGIIDLVGNPKGLYLYKIINATSVVKQGRIIIL